MQKLALHHDTLLSGNFKLKPLNFLFIFQVNCPGCFFHGIPTVNKLYDDFNMHMSFLGLSTAFEDYKYNTKENTELLLHKKIMIGETKKAFESQEINTYEHPIKFPVAMDSVANASFNFDKGAETICKINPNYTIWPKFEQENLKKKVIHYLKNHKILSLTFTLNQMKGTPTMLLFNDDYEILYQKFGYVDHTSIKQDIEKIISRF